MGPVGLPQAHAQRALQERITTNIAHLSLSRLRDVEFPLPPVEEQGRLVAAAADQWQAIARLRASIGVARRRGEALRQALLEAAFSGRLTGSARDEEVIEELSEA